MPPKASPNTQTTSPQPALTSPAILDDQPAGAAISHAPMPSWIHTAAAPAWIGWNDQAVPAQLTTCWTHTGELAAVGSITCPGRPAAIAGWACRIPSKIHRMPKPIRSRRRPLGSAKARPAERRRGPG